MGGRCKWAGSSGGSRAGRGLQSQATPGGGGGTQGSSSQKPCGVGRMVLDGHPSRPFHCSRCHPHSTPKQRCHRIVGAGRRVGRQAHSAGVGWCGGGSCTSSSGLSPSPSAQLALATPPPGGEVLASRLQQQAYRAVEEEPLHGATPGVVLGGGSGDRWHNAGMAVVVGVGLQHKGTLWPVG